MMDFSLVFLVALALTGAAHSGPVFPNSRSTARSSELHEVIREFADLLPYDEIMEIAMQYAATDAEVQTVIAYAQTEAFKDLVTKIERIEDVINFFDYLEEAGLEIYDAINTLNIMLGIPHLVPGNFARNMRITGGVAGLMADIKAVLPLEKIKILYELRMETSAAFADFVHHMQAPRFQELINAIRANKEFQEIDSFAREHGVDVKAIMDLLSTMLGLKYPVSQAVRSSELHGVIREFADLLPHDDIMEIAMQYAATDAEVQAVIAYVQTQAFKDLVTKFESIEDVINFYDYLEKAGLEIYDAINTLHMILGIPPLAPGNFARNMRITGGVAGLIADIKAILPLKRIQVLYELRMETSAAFADFVHHMQAPRFQELISAIRANKEFQEIDSFAREHGVDVKAIMDLFSTMLGLKYPVSRAARSSELREVIQEFADLLPHDEIMEIAMQYATTDAEVQAVIAYVQTEAFKDLVTKIESIEDVINFFDYLEKAGLEIYDAINTLHMMLGIPPLVPGNFARNTRITGGVAGLMADIKAVLPLEKIKILYELRMETSAAFADFVHHMQAPRFQELINAIRANKEFQEIDSFAREHGVDVKAIMDLFSTMLGLKYPVSRAVRSNELREVLGEFADLLPYDEIMEIAMQYATTDAEVQAVIAYVRTEAFKDLLTKFESIEDVINFYDYLEKAGLKIYDAINTLHMILGIPPLVPENFARNMRITGGVAGLIADIKAVLPLEKIKILYELRMETSAAFADFVHHMQAPRFQELINAIRANKEFQEIDSFAREHGVDVKAIMDLFSTMLGLKYPVSRAVRSNELREVLGEFADLLPYDEIMEIAMQYATTDAEVQAVIAYVRTEAFKDLLTKFESIEDVINFYDYLEKAGLEIYDAINTLHMILGIPPLVPENFARNMRITGGVAGLIADIKAVLPLEKIKILYELRMETSAAFADFVHHMQAPRFQELINAIRANKEFQEIDSFAREHGVDVKAIMDLFSTMLGLKYPVSRAVRSNELREVLGEFADLLPYDEIMEIAMQYAATDAEVQAVIAYVRTEAFKDLVTKFESIEDVINFFDYLEKAGLEIYDAINTLHMILGIPPLAPGNFARNMRITGGVAGLIADIKAVLPLKRIKILYELRMETSAAFADFVHHMQAPRFQELINAIRANKEFQKIDSFAREHGVDVKAIMDLFSTMLGLEYPNKTFISHVEINNNGLSGFRRSLYLGSH